MDLNILREIHTFLELSGSGGRSHGVYFQHYMPSPPIIHPHRANPNRLYRIITVSLQTHFNAMSFFSLFCIPFHCFFTVDDFRLYPMESRFSGRYLLTERLPDKIIIRSDLSLFCLFPTILGTLSKHYLPSNRHGTIIVQIQIFSIGSSPFHHKPTSSPCIYSLNFYSLLYYFISLLLLPTGYISWSRDFSVDTCTRTYT